MGNGTHNLLIEGHESLPPSQGPWCLRIAHFDCWRVFRIHEALLDFFVILIMPSYGTIYPSCAIMKFWCAECISHTHNAISRVGMPAQNMLINNFAKLGWWSPISWKCTPIIYYLSCAQQKIKQFVPSKYNYSHHWISWINRGGTMKKLTKLPTFNCNDHSISKKLCVNVHFAVLMAFLQLEIQPEWREHIGFLDHQN